MASSQTVPKGRSMTKKMGVPESGITVLMNLLGQDVGPNQFLRELSKNSLEAMDLSRHPKFTGKKKIVWTWDEHWLNKFGVLKACLVDTGVGMTPEQLEQHINNLSSSGGALHGLQGNYGLGAKIAALTVNHHGVIYQSWKNGFGYMIHLWKDPVTGHFGLREFDRPNTRNKYVYQLPESVKPKEIDQNGTKVILLGMREDENTFEPPGKELVWIPRYLNSKFFRLPTDVDIKFEATVPHRDNSYKNNRTINGMEAYLSSHSKSSGVVNFDEVDIYWWILSGVGDSRSHNDRGHVAAIYQDELYDIRAGKSLYSALAQFGIAFGANKVVIYAEPKGIVSANASRSNLFLGYDPSLGEEGKGEPLPWEEWGRMFYKNMPQELLDLQEEERGDNQGASNIRELLSKVKEFFNISRKSFRIKASGKVKGESASGEVSNTDPLTDGEDVTIGDGGSTARTVGSGRGRSKTKKTSSEDNPYCKFTPSDSGDAHEESDIDGPFPDYQWIDNPEEHGLVGYAATYSAVSNLIKINRHFGGFVDLRDKLISRSSIHSPVVSEEIKDSIEKWFGLSLVEAVVGINSIKDIANWDQSQVEKALSNEALTTMCMQRYYTVQSIKRETSQAARYNRTE
jgi:hypothetical protein